MALGLETLLEGASTALLGSGGFRRHLCLWEPWWAREKGGGGRDAQKEMPGLQALRGTACRKLSSSRCHYIPQERPAQTGCAQRSCGTWRPSSARVPPTP